MDGATITVAVGVGTAIFLAIRSGRRATHGERGATAGDGARRGGRDGGPRSPGGDGGGGGDWGDGGGDGGGGGGD